MPKSFVPVKPMYTPDEQVESGLYTEGQEWMTVEGFEEYIGLYHKYPNGAVYSEGTFNSDSIHLMEYTEAIKPQKLVSDPTGNKTTMNNSIYFNLTETRFNKYIKPRFFYPKPTEQDYEQAQIVRYFVQRINRMADIYEVDTDAFDSVNKQNEFGIDGGLYRKKKIEWTINGPLVEARKVNLKVLQEAEADMPGIMKYLTDLDEFHIARHMVKEDTIDPNNLLQFER
jgi:hypothetical protein